MAKMSTESWCTAWGSIYWVQEDIQRDQHNDGRIQKSIVTTVTGAEHEQMRGIGPYEKCVDAMWRNSMFVDLVSKN